MLSNRNCYSQRENGDSRINTTGLLPCQIQKLMVMTKQVIIRAFVMKGHKKCQGPEGEKFNLPEEVGKNL